MKFARLIAPALVIVTVMAGGSALARSDFEKVREASLNAPLPVAEGTEAAEALNADINARNAAARARDQARDAEFARRQREYEARKQADAAAYAEALADHEARKAAVAAQRRRDLADWEARVRACKAGDRTACAPK